MKKIILIVGLVFSLGNATPQGIHSINNGASQTVPVGNKDKKPVSLKEMLNGFINSLKSLQKEQKNLTEHYNDVSEKLETVTSDLTSIVRLIKINRSSIEEFKKDYDDGINVCSGLKKKFQQKCKDRVKQGYDEDLGGISNLQQLLVSLQDKLNSAKDELQANQAMTANDKRRIKRKIEIIERQINAVKGED